MPYAFVEFEVERTVYVIGRTSDSKELPSRNGM